jgi:hypothetical protein
MPNRSMLYRHLNLNGYEAIFLKDFTRYLGLQEKAALNATGLCRTDLYSPLSKSFSVKYIFTPRSIIGRRPVFAAGGLNIYELPGALPRLFFSKNVLFIDRSDTSAQYSFLKNTTNPPDDLLMAEGNSETSGRTASFSVPASLLSFGSSEDCITAEFLLASPAAAVLTDVYYPGWRAASAAGKFAVLRAHRSFRLVFLPAGDYTGERRLFIYYLPLSFILGMLITCMTVITAAFYFAMRPTK